MAIDYLYQPDESVLLPRSVAREARFMRAANAVKAAEAIHIVQLDREVALTSLATVALTIAEIRDRVAKISDPWVRNVVEKVANRYIDLHAKHQEGTYRITWEQFAVQLSRVMTPHSPNPDSIRENLISVVFGV